MFLKRQEASLSQSHSQMSFSGSLGINGNLVTLNRQLTSRWDNDFYTWRVTWPTDRTRVSWLQCEWQRGCTVLDCPVRYGLLSSIPASTHEFLEISLFQLWQLKMSPGIAKGPQCRTKGSQVRSDLSLWTSRGGVNTQWREKAATTVVIVLYRHHIFITKRFRCGILDI